MQRINCIFPGASNVLKCCGKFGCLSGMWKSPIARTSWNIWIPKCQIGQSSRGTVQRRCLIFQQIGTHVQPFSIKSITKVPLWCCKESQLDVQDLPCSSNADNILLPTREDVYEIGLLHPGTGLRSPLHVHSRLGYKLQGSFFTFNLHFLKHELI